MDVKMLRDADFPMLAAAAAKGKLTEKQRIRARHVIGEIKRTLDAVEAMKAGNDARLGELMYASHESLRNDYEVSCEELDAIVDTARNCDGVYGARMTGGGFGGCAIILARTDKAGRISEEIAGRYATKFGLPCQIFTTRAAAGAHVVE